MRWWKKRMGCMRSYRLLTTLLTPVLPLWIGWRRLRGKEDGARIGERFGHAALARPTGTLLWLHAASVGEANSVLLLIANIRERFPAIHILLTTGTVTSARLMQARLPKGVIHQYAPVDTPGAVGRFIRHWQPDIAFWVESEFWPNLIHTTHESDCFMGVINARLSEKSFRSWNKHPAMIGELLSCFDIVFAQSVDDGKRLQALGAKHVLSVGNLKYDAALLPCDEEELLRMKNAVGNRPVWLAASTHPGEEAVAAQTHRLLGAARPDLLTIIVPRHPERGPAIADMLRKDFRVRVRSQGEAITADTQIYVADSLGELGLFYRLCTIVFVGGSLAARGGQNPLEPARLSCAVIAGPHTHNFADMYAEMEKIGGCLRAENAKELAAHIDRLMKDPAQRDAMQNTVRRWMEGKSGSTERVLAELAPVFNPKGTA